jgi:hypothetical protein
VSSPAGRLATRNGRPDTDESIVVRPGDGHFRLRSGFGAAPWSQLSHGFLDRLEHVVSADAFDQARAAGLALGLLVVAVDIVITVKEVF